MRYNHLGRKQVRKRVDYTVGLGPHGNVPAYIERIEVLDDHIEREHKTPTEFPKVYDAETRFQEYPLPDSFFLFRFLRWLFRRA